MNDADWNLVLERALNKGRREIAFGNVASYIPELSKANINHLGVCLCTFGKVSSKVGMEPSSESFNSLVELDLASNHPHNPTINSGAITVASCLVPVVSFDEMLALTRRLCHGLDIRMDEAVFHS